jgi:hypothetical protein
MRQERLSAAWTGVAFLRPAGRVSRRVNNLLALADGGTETAGAGRVPYLAAALLVALLGLQAGARLAAQDASAFAIVVGTTEGVERGLWVPKHERSRALREAEAREAGRSQAPQAVARSPRYPELLDGIVKEKDLPKWMRTLSRLSARLNVSPTTLRWQGRAVPLLDQSTVGPISFIRMESQLGGL